MDGIKTLSIHCNKRYTNYKFPLSQCYTPKKINIKENKYFYIPFYDSNNFQFDLNESINYLLYDKTYSKNYNEYVKYDKSKHLFIFKNGLKFGIYYLHIKGEKEPCQINVTQKITRKKSEIFRELSNSKPLNINKITGNRINGWKISLNSFNDTTRVHIFITHRYQSFPIFNYLKEIPFILPKSIEFNTPPNVFTKQRSISEEYRYVLERINSKSLSRKFIKKANTFIKSMGN